MQTFLIVIGAVILAALVALGVLKFLEIGATVTRDEDEGEKR
jgi:hypothetical protein